MVAAITTIAEELFLYQNDRNDCWTFFPAVLAITVMVVILWKTDLTRSHDRSYVAGTADDFPRPREAGDMIGHVHWFESTSSISAATARLV